MDLPDIELNPVAIGLAIGFWLLETLIMFYSGTFKVLPITQSVMIVFASLPIIYFIALWQLNK